MFPWPIFTKTASQQEAVEAAKAKLEEHKQARIAAEKLLVQKMAELKALAHEEESKIKTQVKEKMTDSVVRIEEDTAAALKELQQKQALLRERDFMI